MSSKINNKLFQVILLAALFAATPLASAQELPVIGARPIPECFGVNVHFAENAKVHYLKDKIKQHIKLLKQAGFGWVRIDLRWSEIETWEGEYDFDKYDIAFEALQNAGIGIIAILGYSNKFYDNYQSPKSDAALNAFGKFVAAAAERYKDMNVIWEIYNEPNIQNWSPSPNADQYIKFATTASEALRRISPSQPIVGPALSGPMSYGDTEVDRPMFRDFLIKFLDSDVAHSWSAITVHPYRNCVYSSPETASSDFEKIRELMLKRGYDLSKVLPVAGEWGFSTSSHNIDEITQAAYAVRSLLWATTEKMPFSVWYNWQEQGKDQNDEEHKYGILRFGDLDDENAKKPAFNAIRQMSTLLRGYYFDKIIKKDNGVMIVSFVKDGTNAFAIWSTDNQSRDIEFTLPKGRWALTHILENPYITESYGNKPEKLNINSMPVIVTQP